MYFYSLRYSTTDWTEFTILSDQVGVEVFVDWKKSIRSCGYLILFDWFPCSFLGNKNRRYFCEGKWVETNFTWRYFAVAFSTRKPVLLPMNRLLKRKAEDLLHGQAENLAFNWWQPICAVISRIIFAWVVFKDDFSFWIKFCSAWHLLTVRCLWCNIIVSSLIALLLSVIQ